MAPLSAVSRETVFATGCIGVLVGSATGVLFPTFWRFVSDAILMQDSPTGKSCPMPVLRLTVVTVELMVELVKQSDMAASPKGEAEMEAKQGNAI
jgi:hypothetical protein